MNTVLKGVGAAALAAALGLGTAYAGSGAKPMGDTKQSAGAGDQQGTNMQVTEQEAVQLFETIDGNSDDKVTQKEWTDWQQPAAGTDGQSGSAPTQQSSITAFKALDLDQSGELEKQEFVQAALALHNENTPGTHTNTPGSGVN